MDVLIQDGMPGRELNYNINNNNINEMITATTTTLKLMNLLVPFICFLLSFAGEGVRAAEAFCLEGRSLS